MRKIPSRLPKRIGQYTQAIVRPVFKSRGLMEGKILTHWEEIVGEKYARLSLPEKITFSKEKRTEGTLHLNVTSSASLLLHYAQNLILERVNIFFGYKAVTKVRLSHGLKPPELTTSMRKPKVLSEDEKNWLHQQTSMIKDNELKKCLDQLGKTISSFSTLP